MRINIEANAEELAKLKDSGFLVEEFTDVICDLIDHDLPVPLPKYTVTLNEPSAIQAQLVEALQTVINRFGPGQNHEIFSKRHALQKVRYALAAAGVQP